MHAVLLYDIETEDFSHHAIHVPAGTHVLVDMEYSCFTWGEFNIHITQEDYEVLN